MSPLIRVATTLLALNGPCQAQAYEASSDIGGTEIDVIIRKHGLSGTFPTHETSPLSVALRDYLKTRATDGGLAAMEGSLAEAGASCQIVGVERHCEIRRSRIIRSIDLFFPKYGRTEWQIAISYDRRGAGARNLRVTYKTVYRLIE